jgi:hypothetical protein
MGLFRPVRPKEGFFFISDYFERKASAGVSPFVRFIHSPPLTGRRLSGVRPVFFIAITEEK